MRSMPRLLVVLTILLGTAATARAADVPVIGHKLSVADETMGAREPTNASRSHVLSSGC